MVRLSVNVNKVATVRNSRGGEEPSPVRAALACVEAGAHGITVHPRADQRHIRPHDVYDLAKVLSVELNIEGDPRPDLIEMVLNVKPAQCTLVPVRPGELTSDHGWNLEVQAENLRPVIARLKDAGIRVSLFLDAQVDQVERAREVGADRVELYTAPYAWAKTPEAIDAEYRKLEAAARRATELGLGVNAGHDLNLENLPRMRSLPGLLECSIGHALISHALFVGLRQAVKDYLLALGWPAR